jgi:hypothetical protein
MVTIWVEQIAPSPGLLGLGCELFLNGEETGIIFTADDVVITDVHEITFGGFAVLPVESGDVFGANIRISYTGINMNVYWGSIQYPSNLVIPGDWVDISAADPAIDQNYEKVTISADTIHALGTEEFIDFQIDIQGPTTPSSIIGPSYSISGDTISAEWDWMYGIDSASEGAYSATITATDNSGNTWEDSVSFLVSYDTPPPPPPPPPETNWTTLNPITWHQEWEGLPSLMQDADGTFWMAWSRWTNNGKYDIFVKNSQDGINWSSAHQVTSNSSYEIYPSMIQDSNGIFWLAFSSNWYGDYTIWITNSTDGFSWITPHRILTHRYSNIEPSLLQASDGTYWIAWTHLNSTTHDYDIRVTASLDGINWDDNFGSVTSDYYYDFSPCLIQDSTGTFRLAWDSDRFGNNDILVSTSQNPQYSWTAPGRITTDSSWNYNPSLIENVDGGFNISWESDRSGDDEIWFAGSSDWTYWTLPEMVTESENPNSNKNSPCLIQDAHETLWIAWHSWSSSSEDIWLSYKRTNDPPTVVLANLAEEQSGSITINYYLKDSGSDLCDIDPQFSLDGINFNSATMGSGGHGTKDLTSYPSGTPHSFVWDSDFDMPLMDDENVYFRITPYDCQVGSQKTTAPFHVDNNAEPEIQIDPIEGIKTESIAFTYVISDKESDKLTIVPQYSIDGENYEHASKGDDSDDTNNLKSTPSGRSYVYVWDTTKNLDNSEEDEVYFRITVEDYEEGETATTSQFQLDNKAPTISSGPLVSSKTHESVIISWETDEPSDGIIYYGMDVNYGFAKTGVENTSSHSIFLDSLEAETDYHFYVTSTDFMGNGPTESIDDVFTTELPPNDPPTVTITSIENKDKVSGKVTIFGDASDPQGDDTIEFVEVKIDEDDWVRAEGDVAWKYKLDTTEFSNGKHYIYARAYDGRDYSQEASLEIKIDNSDDSNLIWMAILFGLLILVAIIVFFARKSRTQRPHVITTHEFNYEQPREFIPTAEPMVMDAQQPLIAEPVGYDTQPSLEAEPVGTDGDSLPYAEPVID